MRDSAVPSHAIVWLALLVVAACAGAPGRSTGVPTLRYVWTNDREPIEAIIVNPYFPKSVRSLVVESGERHLGDWVQQRRNVVQDFAKAFGHPPREPISAIALFTDNDQTGQPVEAYYSWARSVCAP